MGLCWKVFLPLILLNIVVLGVLKLILFPPGTVATAGDWRWWILMALELVMGAAALFGFSRLAGLSWFGKAERPVLVDRSLILVRTTHGGRGTIEGEARAVEVTRAPGGE
jgi:hypothetical protein